MGKSTTMFDYFKRKNTDNLEAKTDDPALPSASADDVQMSENSNSFHRVLESSCEGNQVLDNERLLLKVTIDVVRFLAFQGLLFDDFTGLISHENFRAFLDLVASFNEKVTEAMNKAPENASYTSPEILREILHVFSNKVRKSIREEIGDAKFCIIVDKAYDVSLNDIIAIVLRFVDKDGFVQERFFGLVHVSNFSALTLKDGIYSVLSHHCLNIQNIRGQGYNRASDMRGEWSGLQALVSNDCPHAYHIHCFVHCLQLALAAASKNVIPVQSFFMKLTSVVNVVGECNEKLKSSYAAEIAHMIDMVELESGRGFDEISTLQWAGDTRRSSHLKSFSSLIKIFSPICEILLNVIDDETSSQRGEADLTYEELISFEFVFVLHLMKEVMEITNSFCQALQCQSQNILNVLHFVSFTKVLIQKFGDDGWDGLLTTVKSFCEACNIDVPDMNARYVRFRGLARHRHQQDYFTIEHHYRVDIFNATIDSIIQELNRRFSEHVVELLRLSSALDPREACESFRIEDILLLVNKFYPQDFTDLEKQQLKVELDHYEHDVVRHLDFKKLSSISELCQWLAKSRKSIDYHLIYRVVILVLTLPVSIATTERAFSAMNIVKTWLVDKVQDDFLADSLILYIEKETAAKFSLESIIDDFQDFKERRVPF
ncbi:uncharacterized protein LOC142611967 [Castanea sativa]|uniref:uncharacterized protein LOC142611967 n=1 Tax=Castanea sativa TaxID=21020 RepID=UPI003F651C20